MKKSCYFIIRGLLFIVGCTSFLFGTVLSEIGRGLVGLANLCMVYAKQFIPVETKPVTKVGGQP